VTIRSCHELCSVSLLSLRWLMYVLLCLSSLCWLMLCGASVSCVLVDVCVWLWLLSVCWMMPGCDCDCCLWAVGWCLCVCLLLLEWLICLVVFVSHLSWTHWANTENRSFFICLSVCNFFMSHSFYYYQRWAHSRYNNLKEGLPQGHICNLYSKINVSTTANPHICNHFFVTSRQLQARNLLRKDCAATVYLYSHNRNFFSSLQFFEVMLLGTWILQYTSAIGCGSAD
jgi:hypothetical protein